MKPRAITLALIVCGCCLIPCVAHAQAVTSAPTNGRSAPNLSDADIAWIDLRAALLTPDVPSATPTTPETRREAQLQRAARMKRAADLAKSFVEKYPQHAKVDEARAQEVLALINARHAGDATVEGRLVEAVQAMGDDKKIAASQRVRAIAAYQFNQAMRVKAANKVERLAKIETVARSLTVSFPNEPQGYESLLTVATAVDSDDKAKELANELAKGKGPLEVRQEAKYLAERLDLVRQPVSTALRNGNAKTKHKEGQPMVIYTWATWSPGSIALAAKLQQRLPNSRLIGINLDTDSSIATAAAAEKKIPGEQEYDDRGREGAVAQSLKLRRPGQIVIVDGQGVIRSVRAELDLERALTNSGI